MLRMSSEHTRIDVLRGLDILDTAPEQPFNSLVDLAQDIFKTSICAISLIGPDRQWFKASVGLHTSETPRAIAFCDFTIRAEGALVVADTLRDDRFAANPLVVAGPRIRFYAGATIQVQDYAVGAICIADQRPRHDFSRGDVRQLERLANLVAQLLEIRKEGWPEPRHYAYVD